MRSKRAGWLNGLRLGILMAAGLSTAAAAGTYELTIGETEVSFSGDNAKAFAVNGEVPGPLLRFKEGEDVTIHVTNTLDVPTSVHWHGLLLPGDMDGVPGFNGFPGIAPGETFTYRFPIRQAGTYWYHAHSAYQEQEGVYGPLVIDPKGADPVKADREHVIFLSDWTDERGAQVHANLKAMPDYYNYAQNTLLGFFREASEEGFSETLAERAAWGEMRMMPSDIADVSGYTFLMNGQPERTPWAGTFKPHERVRLRLINGSAMTYFDFRIPGHKLQVVQADGQNVEPVSVDELRIAVAETYDVIVTPHSAAPLQLIAEAMDRSGFALGTLSTDGAPANLPRPEQRPRGELAMSDMGMNHAGMDHGSMDQGDMDHGSMDHSQMPHDAMPQEEMSHTMDHGSMNHGEMDHEAMGHEAMGHGKMDHGAMPMKNDGAPPSALSRDHELVPSVGAPEGARVLSYADLRALEDNDDLRAPMREIEVRLGGTMERYLWTINGKKFSEAEPIKLNYGERARLTFINESMMNHPMHLHGMFVELENGQPREKQPRKHIVNVGPGRSYSVEITADEPGEWAFHCHLLYHMASGMMRKVVVAELPEGA
ncbi:copper resistance protein A [Tepidicaulis marinus]|uniref:Copper resistance protein A n=1 Tax=Tepidicaulis marinus TaxID=1333998 RepID=A0A081BBV6_9HYPH|nr:copper resistance system multicopper oxidase [Tepidicaulis marinus]GAK45524.1 copper resistance protein A [Tepidicaulis marinus]